MASNGGTGKDPTARRRRIMERGSDRLALITGQVQSISSSPSSPASAPSHHSYTTSCPPLLSRLSDQIHSSDENTRSSLKTETVRDDVISEDQPFTLKSETKTEGSRKPTLEPHEIQSFPITSSHKKTPITSAPKTSPNFDFKNLYKTLNPNQLRPAIAASQDIRRKCSFIAAILVLLSYLGFPIVGSYLMRSIILSRPLFLLILTNLTIAIGPLLLENQNAMGKVEEEGNAAATNDADFTDHIGLALEWGMFLQTTLFALFMDSSIYSVVVVCGMSFLQKLGW